MTDLIERLANCHLPITTAHAATCGVDRYTLARMVRTGAVRRICHGAYVPAPVWADATPEERHLLVSRGVLGRHPSAVLSHTAAVIAHELPVVGVDLRVVHLTRSAAGRTGRAGRHPHVQVHPPLAAAAYTTTAGLHVCTEAVAALQVADWHGVNAGMVAAEAAMWRRTITHAELRDARQLVRLGRGRAHADVVVRLADASSESPGETLTRLLLRSLGVSAVQQQARIVLPSGQIARVDFLLADHGVVIEFDGSVKYEGAGGRAALVREKRREDGLRAAGYRVVRLTWSDLRRPEWVRTQLLAAGWTPTT